MHEHYVSFFINDISKIVIELEESLDNVHCCYEAPIAIIHDNRRFDLSTHSVREFLSDLNHFAKQLVDNNLQLHESITKDLGFLLNEDLQYKPGLFTIKKNGYDSWIGYNYLLVMDHQEVLWLYNSSDTIICEVTPKFPFSYRNYAKDKNYVHYKTWIKNYKPYFTTKATTSFIQKWIMESHIMLEKIEKNIQKWHEQENRTNE